MILIYGLPGGRSLSFLLLLLSIYRLTSGGTPPLRQRGHGPAVQDGTKATDAWYQWHRHRQGHALRHWTEQSHRVIHPIRRRGSLTPCDLGSEWNEVVYFLQPFWRDKVSAGVDNLGVRVYVAASHRIRRITLFDCCRRVGVT